MTCLDNIFSNRWCWVSPIPINWIWRIDLIFESFGYVFSNCDFQHSLPSRCKCSRNHMWIDKCSERWQHRCLFWQNSERRYKRSLVRTLFDRVSRICTPGTQDKGSITLTDILVRNRYPRNFINRSKFKLIKNGETWKRSRYLSLLFKDDSYAFTTKQRLKNFIVLLDYSYSRKLSLENTPKWLFMVCSEPMLSRSQNSLCFVLSLHWTDAVYDRLSKIDWSDKERTPEWMI